MKVFENQNLIIEQDERQGCLTQNWKGFANSQRFREGIEKSVELFKNQRFTKILSNTKDFGLVKKEDTEWVNSYSMPLLIQNGLRYIAFVIPSNAFAQMSVDNFKKEMAGPVELRYFESLDKAKAWLAEVV